MEDHLEKLKYVNKVLSNTYYSGFVAHMKDVMELTLDPEFLNNSAAHLEAQKVILVALEELEPLITQGRRLAAGADEELLVQAHRNKLVASGYREIADGLAWRTLGYDRARIRILSEAQTPGFIATPSGAKLGRQSELQYAQNVVDHGCFVLMHDVTNQMMVGDLSMVHKFGEVPHLAEIKKNKLITAHTIQTKVDKKQKLSQQEHRLIQAQIMLDRGTIGNFKNQVQVKNYTMPVKTFHGEVQKIITEARKTGVGRVQPASYIHIEVVDFRNKDIDPKAITDNPRPFDGDNALPFSNYDNLVAKMEGQVFRGKPPYTVYPYEVADRIDLMTGELYLHTVVSVTKLQEEFLKRGWKFEINIPDDREPYSDIRYGGTELFQGMSEDDLVVTLSHPESGFTARLSMDIISKFGYEFLDIDTVLAPYIERIKDGVAQKRSGSVFIVNDNENDIWD
jgi:hypothetical protein